MVKEQKRTSAKQDRHQKMNSTSGLLKDRIHNNATRENKEKNKIYIYIYIIQNEQFATVVLKFKPQVANKSEIKSTTIETCFLDKLKFHLRMFLTTSSVCSLSHVCLPAKVSRPMLLV